MKTLEFKPLATNIVTLHQKYRGECQKFVDYMLRKWWHVFEFRISDEDAKALFREMKTFAKALPQNRKIYISQTSWYLHIHTQWDDVALGKWNGEWFIQVASGRN